MGSPHIERNLLILEARKAGKSLDQVGREFGISRERVRQIEVKAARTELRDYVTVSCKIVNAMANEGFLPKTGPLTNESIKKAMPAFYDYMIEEVPAIKENGWPWRKFPAGPRWIRVNNFGKKSLQELCDYLGVPNSATLSGEKARLRAALRQIANTTTASQCQRIAREALGE